MKIDLNAYNSMAKAAQPVKRDSFEVTLSNGMTFGVKDTPDGLEITAIECRSTKVPGLVIRPSSFGNVVYLRAIKG